jgi:hypothetical protein
MSEFAMPDPAIGRESYMHRAAKEVLVRWLREAASAEGGDWWQLNGLAFRPNRREPFFGIHMEYPIATDASGAEQVWDEIDWQNINGEGDPPDNIPIPTAEQLLAAGVEVGCVCDVAIWHKGMCSAVIEVVHKHPTPKWKIDFLRRMGVQEIYEISAEWVMRQTACPAAFPLKAV